MKGIPWHRTEAEPKVVRGLCPECGRQWCFGKCKPRPPQECLYCHELKPASEFIGCHNRNGRRRCKACRGVDKIWEASDPEAESAVQEWIHEFVMNDYECRQAIEEAMWQTR